MKFNSRVKTFFDMSWIYTILFEYVKKRIQELKNSGDVDDVDLYLKKRDRDKDDIAIRKNLNTLSDNISSMLTHVSAMIASTGILLMVFNDSVPTQIFVFLELLGYCAATVLLLANLPYSSFVPYNKSDIEDRLQYEQMYDIYLERRYLYILSARLVMFLTFMFVVIVIMHIGMAIFRHYV